MLSQNRNHIKQFKTFLIFGAVLFFAIVLRLQPWHEITKLQQQEYLNAGAKPYLFGADSYHWRRYIEKTLINGFPGDKIKNGKVWDDKMFYPLGTEVEASRFFSYFNASLFRLVSFFNKSVDLHTVLLYQPLIIFSLFCILFFYFCKDIFGAKAALISLFLLSFSPAVFLRSFAGWLDKDNLSLLFVLLISLFFWKTDRASGKSKLLFLVAQIIVLFLFSFLWQGWWINLLLLLFVYGLIEFRNKGKNNRILLISLFAFALVTLVLVLKTQFGISLWQHYVRPLLLANQSIYNELPQALSQVRELQRSSLATLSFFYHGYVLLISALLSLVYLFYVSRNDSGKKNTVLFLIAGSSVYFLAAISAQRFIFFLSFFLSISLGVMLKDIIFAAGYFKTRTSIRKTMVFLLGFFLMAFLCLHTLRVTMLALSIKPAYSDDFAETMERIKNGTGDNSPIIAWWSYGDWIKSETDRPVVVDNQSQDTILAYLMARFFMTSDEREALRILNVFGSESTNFYWKLKHHFGSDEQTYYVLSLLIKNDEEKTRKFLNEVEMSPEGISYVCRTLYKKHNEDFHVYVMNDMLKYIPNMSNLAFWNFEKVLDSSSQRVGRKKTEITKTDSVSNLSLQANTEKDKLIFSNGLVYDMAKNEIIDSPKDIATVYFYNGNELTRKRLKSKGEGIIIFTDDSGNWFLRIISSDRVAKSVLARLLFFNGFGLNHFIKQDEMSDDNNFIYRVSGQ